MGIARKVITFVRIIILIKTMYISKCFKCFKYGVIAWSLLTFSLSAAESYKFRIYLKDKGATHYSLEQPEKFLSKKAVERRSTRGIAISETDFPLSSDYLDTIVKTGSKIVVQSKWFNTVVVHTPDSTLAKKLDNLAFVDSVKWVWKGSDEITMPDSTDTSRFSTAEEILPNPYGYAKTQIHLHNGERLHKAGFRGQGIRIAVIDAGFMNVNRISAFDSVNIQGTRNFVFPDKSVYYWDDHGTKVLSCLAANLPGIIIGTAPEAEYWLLKSEDNRSEFPVEEDYWVAAVEYADSVGVDVITSSLGYYTFDNTQMEYGKDALNGKTALISRAATMAASKGILLFSSAGNEGNGNWEKITFPADAPAIVTVGAITEDKHHSTFSSKGFTSDLRIKPDVVALGSGCCVLDSTGNIRYANGTSFATPILAGLAACLWQALPQLSNDEMLKLLQQAAHQHSQPDVEMGYGIPDVYKAYKIRQRKHVCLH